MTEDFYDLLEVSPDADQDEIKDAYREQVRVYHPDVNDDDRAQAQFTAVKTAYDILGDPVERQAYDRLGHEDYVAKRTSGLPSPDVWQSDDDDEDSGTEVSYSESETASASASTAGASTAAGSAGGSTTSDARSSTSTGGAAGGGSTAGASSAGGTADASSATATGTAAGTGTGPGSGGGTGSGTSDRTAGSGGGTADGTDRSRTADTGSTANPLVRWWRRRNVSLPLLWLSVLVYGVGLAQFGLANEGALRSLRAELAGIGADPTGLWAALSADRHGVETTVAFMRGLEVVTPPLERTLWYGALAGVVVLALVGLLVVRAVGREETWGPVTIDETIVVALSLAVPTTLIGGPLLAGAVLMPLLFGVVVRHTRRGPGWTPSYLYVFPVLAPLPAFGAAAAGAATLPVDIAAVVVLPLLGGLGLPLRASIRKHVGR